MFVCLLPCPLSPPLTNYIKIPFLPRNRSYSSWDFKDTNIVCVYDTVYVKSPLCCIFTQDNSRSLLSYIVSYYLRNFDEVFIVFIVSLLLLFSLRKTHGSCEWLKTTHRSAWLSGDLELSSVDLEWKGTFSVIPQSFKRTWFSIVHTGTVFLKRVNCIERRLCPILFSYRKGRLEWLFFLLMKQKV